MIKEITGLRYRCIAAAQGIWVSHKVNLVLLIFKAAASVWVYLTNSSTPRILSTATSLLLSYYPKPKSCPEHVVR